MKSRVLTAIGLIPFVLGTFLLASPWPLLLMALATAGISALELEKLLNFPARYSTLFVTVVAGMAPFVFTGIPVLLLAIGCLFLAVAGVVGGYIRAKDRTSQVGALLAPLWFVSPLICLLILHGQVQPNSGSFSLNPILMAVAPLWGGDSAAYFVGKAFGKRLLAPSISPKKTVEGAIANVAACLVVALPLGHYLGYSPTISALCGLSAGVLGQMGDLYESYLKRQANLKDSGTLLPGHGGILDRIDSILFTAPIVFFIIATKL